MVLLVLAMISCAVAVPFSPTGTGMGYMRCPDGSVPLTGVQGPMVCNPDVQCPATHQCVNKGAAGVCCPRGYGTAVTGVPNGSIEPATGAPCPPPPQPTEEEANKGCTYLDRSTSSGQCQYYLACPMGTVMGTDPTPPGLDMTTPAGNMQNGTTGMSLGVEGSTVGGAANIDDTTNTTASNMSNNVDGQNGTEPSVTRGNDTDIFPLIPTNITGSGENGSLPLGPDTFGPVEANGTVNIGQNGTNPDTSIDVAPGQQEIQGNVTAELTTQPGQGNVTGEMTTPEAINGSSPAPSLPPFAIDPGVDIIHPATELTSNATDFNESTTVTPTMPSLGSADGNESSTVMPSNETTPQVNNTTSNELPEKKPQETTLPSIDEPNEHRVPPGCPPDTPICPISNGTSIPVTQEGGQTENGTTPGSYLPHSLPTDFNMTNVNGTESPIVPDMNGTTTSVPDVSSMAGNVTEMPTNGSATVSPSIEETQDQNGTSATLEPSGNGTTPSISTAQFSTNSSLPDTSTLPSTCTPLETLAVNGSTEGMGNETTQMPTSVGLENVTGMPIDLANISTPNPVLGANESVATPESSSFNETTAEPFNMTGTPSGLPNSSLPTTSSPESTQSTDQTNGSSSNISESINPSPQSVNINEKPPTWDSMFSIRSPLKSIPDAVAFRRSSGPAVPTSGQFVPCQRNEDCFDLREPPEWCDRDQAAYTWTDKSCFCAADTEVQSCIIERFDLASGQAQWTFCTPDNQFVCDTNYYKHRARA